MTDLTEADIQARLARLADLRAAIGQAIVAGVALGSLSSGSARIDFLRAQRSAVCHVYFRDARSLFSDSHLQPGALSDDGDKRNGISTQRSMK